MFCFGNLYFPTEINPSETFKFPTEINPSVILTSRQKSCPSVIQKFSIEFNPSINFVSNLNIFDGKFFVENIPSEITVFLVVIDV